MNVHSDLVRAYARADDAAAVSTLSLTLFLIGLSYSTAKFCLDHGLMCALGWIFFRSMVVVRTFVLMHDCGHNSFFTSSRLNTIVGAILATETLTPFWTWRKGHHYHHQTSGNLKVVRFDMMHKSGDTISMTKGEYDAMPKRQKVFARILRDPSIFFTVIPLFTFGVVYRFAADGGMVNAAIVLKLLLAFITKIDVKLVFMEFLALWITSIVGFFLFHTQHGANTGYRVPCDNYDASEAAIQGATFLQIPWFLKWVTLGIEYHHIHHLNSRVPCYSLKSCHDMGACLGLWKDVNHLSLVDATRSLSNTMWDEQKNEYVPFSEPFLWGPAGPSKKLHQNL